MTWEPQETETHHLPPTSSDERGHVLDASCWCKPDVFGSDVHHRPHGMMEQ